MENASFRGSAIDAAVFDGADLTGCDFKDASTFGHVFVEDELPPH
ncbi:pentapeptide repeat-containing protein [Rhizobium sp. Leaf453]